MKTFVSIPHHEYPASAREHVETRLQALLHHYERIVSVRALLERQGETHRVELVANVGHHATLVVDARADLLDTALEDALGKMTRTLARHKEKLADRHRRGTKRR